MSSIKCIDVSIDHLEKIFNSTSQNLGEKSRGFEQIQLYNYNKSAPKLTLTDNLFADLTFSSFYGFGIGKISNNAFNKTKHAITSFSCIACELVNQSPNYDLWSTLSQMNKLMFLDLGLNVNQIPTNAIQKKNFVFGLTINSKQSLTIQTGAFQNIHGLYNIQFQFSKINEIQKEAFKPNHTISSSIRLSIVFESIQFNNESFVPGSFDGVRRPLELEFRSVHLGYLEESIFKSVLDANKLNTIKFTTESQETSYIDCSDCRNQWLIRDKRRDQIEAVCKDDINKILFDDEIAQKLKTKCKK